MSFDYRKNRNHSDGESFWTSYSDLFLGLSSIFLMLYVVASLRSGTDGIKTATENNKLKVEIQDLKNQLQTYENVKDQYLKSQASKSELNEYNELMDKLTLLQQEANEEKINLRKQAKENEQKEQALNKYQQMVRNLINSNKFSKVKIDNRNQVISEQDEQIETQDTQITALNQDVQQKQNQLRQKDQQIQNVNNQLTHNMNQLKQAFNKAKMSQAAYNQKMAALKKQAQDQLAQLAKQKQDTQNQLAQAQQNLQDTQNQLQNTQGQLAKTTNQVSNLQGQLAGQAADAKAKMDALRSGFAAQQAADKAAFEGALQNQKNLSAGELARQREAFGKAAAAKERKLAGELAGLANQLKDTEGKLAAAQAELADRKNIAQQIKAGFAKAGLKGDIDMETGDVVIDFGATHFDSDSAVLKTEMQQVLQRAMPIYSKSLFGNPKVAEKISAVEVIGFASPTYKGRYVDPNSSTPQDREAIKYNMDLSYRRAKSIFNFILDEKAMNFQYRDTLVPNLKVSGRSFLDLIKMERNIASAQEYCQKYDCKKTQKVIVRFSMDKRK